MPRFFFHIDAGAKRCVVDHKGLMLDDLDQVEEQARLAINDMVAAGSLEPADLSALAMVIENENAEPVLTFRLAH